MSKTLAWEISDELYAAFEQIAARTGRPTEAVAVEWLARQAPRPRPPLSAEELEAARERFAQHIGAVSLGYPTGADNEGIDADLAREYGSSPGETP